MTQAAPKSLKISLSFVSIVALALRPSLLVLRTGLGQYGTAGLAPTSHAVKRRLGSVLEALDCRAFRRLGPRIRDGGGGVSGLVPIRFEWKSSPLSSVAWTPF
jgi:hypothetical protein